MATAMRKAFAGWLQSIHRVGRDMSFLNYLLKRKSRISMMQKVRLFILHNSFIFNLLTKSMAITRMQLVLIKKETHSLWKHIKSLESTTPTPSSLMQPVSESVRRVSSEDNGSI